MALPLAFIGIIYVLVSYAGYLALQSVLTKRHNARRARELGCRDPPVLPSSGILGIDVLKTALAADKNKEFPVEMARRRELVGAETFLYSTLGSTMIFTSGE